MCIYIPYRNTDRISWYYIISLKISNSTILLTKLSHFIWFIYVDWLGARDFFFSIWYVMVWYTVFSVLFWFFFSVVVLHSDDCTFCRSFGSGYLIIKLYHIVIAFPQLSAFGGDRFNFVSIIFYLFFFMKRASSIVNGKVHYR